ncbi:MAG: PhzF family phenazine biosynthesis protein, partial [Bauldia sp.]
AVVLDAAGLDDAAMQAVAREFNLSETVFVLPATNPVHSARLRIFTPAAELPFAGHPTVGTAVLLAHQRLGGGTSEDGETDAVLVLEETVGAIRCGVKIKNGVGHAVFDAPLLPTVIGEPADSDVIAAALGLMPAEIGFENHRASAFTAGMPFTFVPVRDLAVIGRVAPVTSGWDAAFGLGQEPNVYVYTRECVGAGRSFHARMFAPNLGLSEDPATGAAVAAFAGVISRFDGITAGSHRFVVEQGFEIGRPSLIGLEVDVAEGRIAATRIGGDAVIVAEGTLSVD